MVLVIEISYRCAICDENIIDVTFSQIFVKMSVYSDKFIILNFSTSE